MPTPRLSVCMCLSPAGKLVLGFALVYESLSLIKILEQRRVALRLFDAGGNLLLAKLALVVKLHSVVDYNAEYDCAGYDDSSCRYPGPLVRGTVGFLHSFQY